MILALTRRDAPHAAKAAIQFAANHPQVQVDLRNDIVILRGRASESAARLWWRIALLNERLVQEADGQRRELLAGLVA